MHPIIRVILAIALLAASSSFQAPAHATAFAGVYNAFWSAQLFYYTEDGGTRLSVPADVGITCLGGSALFGAAGCTDHAALSLTNNSSADIIESIFRNTGLSITNNSGVDLPGLFVFRTDFSAFDHGGGEIGASVDDPIHEFAAFESRV